MIRWDAILRHYDEHHRSRVQLEQAWFAASASIQEAIRRAALATDDQGKRFHHQRRIPRAALEAARDALLGNTARITSTATFDELLVCVTTPLRHVRGIGELYAYDTALRIGYYRHRLPTRVYVHAGTRTGARRLGLHTSIIERRDLPAKLQGRPAHEVEDILCIYKDHFRPKPDPSNTSSNTCSSGAPKRNAARCG